jgi:hypothetical protein
MGRLADYPEPGAEPVQPLPSSTTTPTRRRLTDYPEPTGPLFPAPQVTPEQLASDALAIKTGAEYVGVTGELARARQSALQTALQQGVTEAESKERLKRIMPPPAVIGEYGGPLLPFQTVTPAPSREELAKKGEVAGIATALQPQTRAAYTPSRLVEPTSLLGALAPGVGAGDDERARAVKEYEGLRETYRQQLSTKGAAGRLEGVNLPVGIPKELYEQKLTSEQIEAEVEKRYPKDQAVARMAENPLFYFTRIIPTALIENAAAGLVGGLAKSALGTLTKEEKERPAELLGTTGVMGNITANLATGGGFMKEFGDIAKYTEGLEGYENIAKGAGLIADLYLSAGTKLPTAVARGAKAAGATVEAARLARAPIAEVAGEAAKRGVAAAARTVVEDLPFVGSKLSSKLQPVGDVRTVWGSKIAEDIDASKAYRKAFDANVGMGEDAAHLEGLKAIRKEGGATSRFLADAANRGPRIRLELDEDYFKLGDDVVEARKSLNQSVSKLEDGVQLSKSDFINLRPYIGAAVRSSPRLSRTLTSAFEKVPSLTRPDKIGVSEFFDQVYKDDTLRNALSNTIKKLVNVEEGTIAVDRAVSRNIPAKVDDLVYVTRDTITTTSGRDALVEEFQNTPFFSRVMKGNSPKKEGALGIIIRRNADVKPYDFISEVNTSASKARATGEIDMDDYVRITNNAARGFITNDDVRKLVDVEVNALAKDTNRGFTSASVAPTKLPQELRETFAVGQARKVEELTGTVPIVMKRLINSTKDVAGSLDSLVTDAQRAALQNAKNSVSNLDKRLSSEFREVVSNDEVRKAYDIPENATQNQIIFGLGRGMKSDSVAMNRQNSIAHAQQVVNSMLFSNVRDYNPIAIGFNPAYNVGKAAIKNVDGYNQLVETIANTPISQIDNILPDIIEKAKDLAARAPNVKVTQKGGKVYVLDKPEEIYLGAYAGAKSTEIVADAISNSIKGVPGIVDEEIEVLAKSIGKTKTEASNFIYEVIRAELKATQAGTKGPLTLFNEATDGTERANVFKRYAKKAFGEIEPESKLGKAGVTSDIIPQWISINAARTGFVESMQSVMERIKLSGTYQDRALEETIQTIDALKRAKIDASRTMSAGLVDEFMSIIGSAPKLEALNKELGSLAESIDKGNKSSATAMRWIRSIMDGYNQAFYWGILSINPAFHAQNILSAPFIIPFTTGRALGLNPKSWVSALHTAALGSRFSTGASDVIAVTDKFGRQWTRGEIYQEAIAKGIFKSQVSAEVNSGFIRDSQAFLSTAMGKGYLKKLKLSDALQIPSTFLGSSLAEYSDNVFRLMVVQDAIKDGKTIEEAIDLGRRSLYDYGAITDVERRLTHQWITRHMLMFYNFQRQSTVTFVKNLFLNPERVMKSIRLTRGITELMIGDQAADELSYYYPADMGAKIILQSAKSAAKDKNALVGGPDMPWKDGLSTIGMLAIDPTGLLLGPTKFEKPERDFESGILYEKFGPLTKKLGQAVFAGKSIFEPGKMTPGVMPPQHMAIWKSVGLDGFITDLFNVKKAEAEPGKTTLDKIEYVMSKEDWDSYSKLLTALDASGFRRPYDEYGKLLITLFPETVGAGVPTAARPEDLAGTAYDIATRTGALKEYRLRSPEEQTLRYLQSQKRLLEQQQRESKGEGRRQYILNEGEE